MFAEACAETAVANQLRFVSGLAVNNDQADVTGKRVRGVVDYSPDGISDWDYLKHAVSPRSCVAICQPERLHSLFEHIFESSL